MVGSKNTRGARGTAKARREPEPDGVVAPVASREKNGEARQAGDFGAGGSGACELCGRYVHELTRHHLIPRSRHGKKRAKRMFDRREMESRIALLCRPCHRNVHATIENKDLEREYNTVPALAAHPGIEKFTRWVGGKPHGVRDQVRAGGDFVAL